MYVPGTTEDVVLIVKVVDRLEELSELEPSRAVTPVGAPETLRAIVCEVPDTVLVDKVDVVDPPAATVPAVGDSAMEKSLVLGTVTLSEYVAVWKPEVAVPVTVKA